MSRILSKRVDEFKLLISLCHLTTLLLLALHIYTYTFPPTPTAIPETTDPEAAWWGLWPITYLPLWAVILGNLAIVLSILYAWTQISFEPKEEEAPPSDFPFQQHTLFITLAILLLTLAFFAFPIAHTRWGDAYILSNAIGWPDPALRLTHSWQAPLDVFLHSQVWLMFHETYQWKDATPVYRLLSPIAGIFYLLSVWALSRDWHRALAVPTWFSFGLLTSLGILQLFFGYIENYSFAAVGILCYLWLARRVLNSQCPLWLAATVLAFTHATHPSTIVLAPSLLYCGWVQWQRDERRNTPNIMAQIALPMLIVGIGTFALMEAGGHGISALLESDRPGGGDGRWFVPLWEASTRWEHYTMFSWPHLRDFLNEQMLVAPVVLPTLIVVLVLYWRKIFSSLPSVRFLTISTICYLLFIWCWNPDYGGQRDWDLFSLAAIPMTMLLIELLGTIAMSRRDVVGARSVAVQWFGFSPLILLQGWHTAAWIYQNTLVWHWP